MFLRIQLSPSFSFDFVSVIFLFFCFIPNVRGRTGGGWMVRTVFRDRESLPLSIAQNKLYMMFGKLGGLILHSFILVSSF